MNRPILALVGALCLVSTLASAQSPPQRRNLISVHPVAALLGVWSLDFERVVRPIFTIGFGVSRQTFDPYPDEFNLFSAEAKFRYYPRARALQGWSLGASLGAATVGEETEEVCSGFILDPTCRVETREAGRGPTIAAMIDYSWLIGRSDRLHLGVGIGAKRIFIDEGDRSDFHFRNSYPTARLSTGYSF